MYASLGHAEVGTGAVGYVGDGNGAVEYDDVVERVDVDTFDGG